MDDLAQMTRWSDSQQTADNRVKSKESEKKDKYQDLARELKKQQLLNM